MLVSITSVSKRCRDRPKNILFFFRYSVRGIYLCNEFERIICTRARLKAFRVTLYLYTHFLEYYFQENYVTRVVIIVGMRIIVICRSALFRCCRARAVYECIIKRMFYVLIQLNQIFIVCVIKIIRNEKMVASSDLACFINYDTHTYV